MLCTEAKVLRKCFWMLSHLKQSNKCCSSFSGCYSSVQNKITVLTIQTVKYFKQIGHFTFVTTVSSEKSEYVHVMYRPLTISTELKLAAAFWAGFGRNKVIRLAYCPKLNMSTRLFHFLLLLLRGRRHETFIIITQGNKSFLNMLYTLLL